MDQTIEQALPSAEIMGPVVVDVARGNLLTAYAHRIGQTLLHLFSKRRSTHTSLEPDMPVDKPRKGTVVYLSAGSIPFCTWDSLDVTPESSESRR